MADSSNGLQLPSVFVSHGAPTVAVEQGPYQEALTAFGQRNQPRAIAVVSAHWESDEQIQIGSGARNSVMYDFGGFSPELYKLEYAAPGDGALARSIGVRLQQAGFSARVNPSHRLDHGAWIPLRFMYPEASIPVVPVSLPDLAPEQLYEVGEALAPLRSEGVMILSSGGIVHNLGRLDFQNRRASVFPWAQEFDNWFKKSLDSQALQELLQYETRAPHAREAVPTAEHFAPVFVTLGAGSGGKSTDHFFEGFEYGSVSMRCFAIGQITPF